MSANRTPNVHTHRPRHRRRLSTGHPNFAARHPKLQNHLDVHAARLNALGPSITGVLLAGGADYEVGDRGTISGGTFTQQATYQVTAVAAGVVTGVEILDGGEYTVNPGVGAATVATAGIGAGLTITTTLAADPTGITAQELLDAMATEPVGLVSSAGRQRNTRTGKDIADQGIPLT